MRVLTVHPGPWFSVADLHIGWVEALRQLGCTVADFNLHDRLSFYEEASLHRDGDWRKAFTADEAIALAAKGVQAACYEFGPDVVLVISGFYIPHQLLDLCRARGSKVVVLHTEEPYETARNLARAAHADLNLLNDPVNLERFRQVTPTAYIPHAYRPALHRPGPVRADCVSDFCFVGTGYPSRIVFLEQVDWDGIDVALAGNWQWLDDDSPLRKHLCHDIGACCHNEETVDLYRATKMSANLYRREADPGAEAGWSMGPREVELAASGTFFLRDPRGEGDEVLPMLPTFDSPSAFEKQLRWWLTRPDRRSHVAAMARAAVADRTFEHNARALLELLGY